VLTFGASSKFVQIHEVKKLKLTKQPGMKVTMLFVVSLCQLLILWKSYRLSGNLLDIEFDYLIEPFKEVNDDSFWLQHSAIENLAPRLQATDTYIDTQPTNAAPLSACT
jgi:hypothetical protein